MKKFMFRYFFLKFTGSTHSWGARDSEIIIIYYFRNAIIICLISNSENKTCYNNYMVEICQGGIHIRYTKRLIKLFLY